MNDIDNPKPTTTHISNMLNQRWCKLPFPEGQRFKECRRDSECGQCFQEYMDAYRDNLKDFR